MPATLRLKETEEVALRKKTIELNKKLVALDKAPVRESELAHFILRKSISCVKINKNGELYIEDAD